MRCGRFSSRTPSTCCGAVVTGLLNAQAESRKSKATRAGLERRAERAARQARPDRFRTEAAAANRPHHPRVIDPDGAATLDRIFDLLEGGATYGDTTRRLNAEGTLTARGGKWTTRTLRRVAQNRAYTGEAGYPQIIDPDRFERVQKSRKRLDPVAVRRAEGAAGSPTATTSYAGSVSARTATPRCTDGSTRRLGVPLLERQTATGLCDAQAIPAAAIENASIEHLADFRWTSKRGCASAPTRPRRARQAGTRQRRAKAQAAKVGHRAEALQASLDSALDAGDTALQTMALNQLRA